MWQSIIKINKKDLQTGDVLDVNSKTPFFKHYAVVFYKNGIAYVTHNPKTGPVIETLEEFDKKRTIYNHFRNEVTKKLTDKFIEDKANELKAYGYNFMEMNCEDYVKRIVGTYIGLDDRFIFTVVVSLVIIISLSIIIGILIKKLK